MGHRKDNSCSTDTKPLARVHNQPVAQVVSLDAPSPSLCQIVEGLRLAETWAASALYQRYGTRINRLVWRMLGADAEHNDVVHQVFINIMRSIGSLREADRLDAWIVSITINTVRREIRSRRVRRIVQVTSDPWENLPAEEGNLEDRVATQRFYQALSSLGSEQQVVYTLFFVAGFSLGEIAGHLGFSMSTAKRRLRRAKKAMAKRFLKDPFLASWVEEQSDESGPPNT